MKQRVTVTLDTKLIAEARWLVDQRLAPSLGTMVELGLAVVIRSLELQRGIRMKLRQVRLRAGRKNGRT
ncbi:MAG TPA: hypothetical protein VKB81_00105 [Nitrospira sp.]|nr:hypothetical protein [Nitrospira sp.]